MPVAPRHRSTAPVVVAWVLSRLGSKQAPPVATHANQCRYVRMQLYCWVLPGFAVPLKCWVTQPTLLLLYFSSTISVYFFSSTHTHTSHFLVNFFPLFSFHSFCDYSVRHLRPTSRHALSYSQFSSLYLLTLFFAAPIPPSPSCHSLSLLTRLSIELCHRGETC